MRGLAIALFTVQLTLSFCQLDLCPRHPLGELHADCWPRGHSSLYTNGAIQLLIFAIFYRTILLLFSHVGP